MKYIILFFALFGFSFAQAEQIKVIKAKGRRAVVSFPKGYTPQKGDTFDLGGDSGSSMMSGQTMSKVGNRNYLIDGSFKYSSADYGDLNLEITRTEIAAGFGWNMGQYEFGPVIAISSNEMDIGGFGTSETSSTDFGGFFEWNFVKNEGDVQLVPFVQGSFLITSQEFSGSSGDGFALGVAGGVKYFFIHSSLAFVPMLSYTMATLDFSGTDADTNTLGLSLALRNYF